MKSWTQHLPCSASESLTVNPLFKPHLQLTTRFFLSEGSLAAAHKKGSQTHSLLCIHHFFFTSCCLQCMLSSACFGTASGDATELQNHCKALRRGLLNLTDQSEKGDRREDSGSEATNTSKTKDLTFWCLEKPLTFILPIAVVKYSDCNFSYCCETTAFSMTNIYSQRNMTTNSTIDHCKVPNRVTYEALSWLMIAEFALGLPLNLSVLYIFVFRYEETQSLHYCLFSLFSESTQM